MNHLYYDFYLKVIMYSSNVVFLNWYETWLHPYELQKFISFNEYNTNIFIEKYLPNANETTTIIKGKMFSRNIKYLSKINKKLQKTKILTKFPEAILCINPYLKDNERPKDIGFHEEIIWIFRESYALPKDYLLLVANNKIFWSFQDDDGKSPDIVFSVDKTKVGIEITNATGPNMIVSYTKEGGKKDPGKKERINWEKKLLRGVENMRKSGNPLDDFSLIEEAITKKMKERCEDWNIPCDRKILVIIVHKHLINDSSPWWVNKLILQHLVDQWNVKFGDNIFERILIS